MKSGRTRETLEAVVRADLAQAGLVPDRLEVQLDNPFPWWLRLGIAGRQFSLGQTHGDVFFCAETTEGRAFDFLSNADQPVYLGRDDRFRTEAFRLVRYALDHPEFRGLVRPVI